MKLVSKDGIEMMDIRSLELQGEVLVVRGKVMGSMPTTIHLRPEDLWQAWGLVTWRMLLALPRLMWRGYRRSRAAAAATAAK
jgi:hypothetical protein